MFTIEKLTEKLQKLKQDQKQIQDMVQHYGGAISMIANLINELSEQEEKQNATEEREQ